MSTWGELKDIKSVHVAGIDTLEISSSLLEISGFISIDDKWSLSHDVSGVSIFTSSLSNLLGLSDLGKIFTSSEFLEGSEEGFGV